MEIPGTASLKEARLRLSAEGGRHIFLLEEPGSGQILQVTPEIATSLLRTRRALDGSGRADPEEAAALANYLQMVRDRAMTGKRGFNPLFLTIPLLDVRPWQPALEGLARALFSRAGAVAFLMLALIAAWVATATNSAFAVRLGDVFSLDAILTFALIAPVLKIVHELGHVLAATRFDVPVRKGGVILIALFPMPFVDCTEADFRADRQGRIIISLAGLMSDVTIGLLAFLLWHLTDDVWARQFLANVFLFCTVTTLVFNLNPLMKLDGYFALSDALGRRNWHMDSSRAARRLSTALSRFRLGEAVSTLWGQPGKLTYAAASAAYKFYILAVIAWALMPKYLGLGTVLVIWGALALFLTPIFRGQGTGRGWFWPATLMAVAAVLAFVPMRYTHVVPLRLDVDGHYRLRAGVEGRVIELRAPGPVEAGEAVMQAENYEIGVEIALNEADQAMFRHLADSAGGRDALAAEAAGERLATARAIGQTLGGDADRLRLLAPHAGWFHPAERLRVGVHLTVGDPVGRVLPDTGNSRLTGILPEIYAEKFARHLTGLDLRTADGIFYEGATARLADSARADPSSGRQFRLEVTAPMPPRALEGQILHLRLTYASEPLWRHALFLYDRLRLNLLQAEDQERRRLER